MIPKQKLGTLIKTVATKGLAPSEETSKLLSDLDAKGVIDKKDNPNNIVNQITEAVNEKRNVNWCWCSCFSWWIFSVEKKEIRNYV